MFVDLFFLLRNRGDTYDYNEPTPPSYDNEYDDESDDYRTLPTYESDSHNADSDGFFNSNEDFTIHGESITDSVDLSDDVILSALGSDANLVHKLEVTVNVLGKGIYLNNYFIKAFFTGVDFSLKPITYLTH